MGTKTLLFTLLAIGFATCTHAQNNTDTSGRAYGFRYYRLPGMPDSATFSLILDKKKHNAWNR